MVTHTSHIVIGRYLERNTTLFPLPGGRSLLIFEPCNTASNFAYYHMVTALARRRRWVMGRANTRALAQTCSALALGSAFFHGSHTRLGSKADNNLIGEQVWHIMACCRDIIL